MTIQTLARIVRHIELNYMTPEDITDDWCNPSIEGDSLVFDYGDDGVARFTVVNDRVKEFMQTDDGDLFEVRKDKLCRV